VLGPIRGPLAASTLRSTKGVVMNRTLLVLAAAGAALALAGPGSTHSMGPVLIIRHQAHGCHAWAIGGGAYKASQVVTLRRGVHLEVGNNDVMAHKLLQLSGPRAKFMPSATMNSLGEMTEIRFPRAGVYRFATKAGEDYTKGMKTHGEDNALKVKVIVR